MNERRITAEEIQWMSEAREIVRLVATDWYVSGEMFHQCFFCSEMEPGEPGEDAQHYHKDDCPVLKAKRLLVVKGEQESE